MDERRPKHLLMRLLFIIDDYMVPAQAMHVKLKGDPCAIRPAIFIAHSALTPTVSASGTPERTAVGACWCIADGHSLSGS